MIKEFNKQNLKTLRADIDAALQTVQDKHGIAVSIGNITFDSGKFTSKLTAVVTDTPGVSAQDALYAQNLKNYASSFNLEGKNVGDKFTLNGHKGIYSLIGINIRKAKPIVFQNVSSGAQYVCSTDQIERATWIK